MIVDSVKMAVALISIGGFFANSLLAQCVDFSADTTTIFAGGSVNFIDLSLDTCNGCTEKSYTWTFSGTGVVPQTSDVPNPTVTYNLAGTYTVKLNVTYGTFDPIDSLFMICFFPSIPPEEKINYITVLEPPPPGPPVVAFSANPLTGDTVLFVTFADLSTNSPNQWQWDFPGGSPSTSTVQNPDIIYFSPGIYDVTLTATNTVGSSSPLTKTNYINVTAGGVGIDQLSMINFQLSIYPNPFKEQVSIQYYIPDRSKVILTIYNLLGQKVKTLVNEVQPKGKFVYTFNTEQLNAGMYLVKLNVEDEILSEPLIYMK